jgi:hypothetical protein
VTGIQKHDDITKYDSIFFKPFSVDCQGAPTAGYHTVLLCGIPLFRDDNGLLPSSHALDKEIRRNTVFKGILSLAPPRWLYNPLNIPVDRCTSSVIVVFYDPEGKTYDRILKLRNMVAMFGSFITIHPFENCPSFSQCQHCLRLGHLVDWCNKPSSLTVCPHCGGPHLALEHAFQCPNMNKHRGRQCNCPPSCFLCQEKRKPGGRHNALSNGCPLHTLYHSSLTESDSDSGPLTHASEGDGGALISDALSGAETLSLTPGASGPFTVMTPDTLRALDAQGADIVRALVPDEVVALAMDLNA